MTAWALDESGRLSGRVAFANLAALRQRGEALIDRAKGETVRFDCSGLEQASSLAVALFVAWWRRRPVAASRSSSPARRWRCATSPPSPA